MSGPRGQFRLPDVGEGLDRAEIVEWLVAVGDTVARDQPLVEILTDKSQTQLPSPTSGVIERLGFAEGDIAEVGDVLVEFASGASGSGDGGGGSEPAAAAPRPAAPTPASSAQPAPARRPKAAPAVRRRALESGVDLRMVTGSGPGGRITDDDLQRAVSTARHTPMRATGGDDTAPAVAPARHVPTSELGQMAPGRHPLRGVRRVTAESMTDALAIPHIHGADEFDATALLAGRRRIKERQPTAAANLTPLAFFVMATADALRRYPLVNASIDTANGHIDVHDSVHVGIAVATDVGLVVPVIRNADRRSLFDLADEIRRLSSAARDRSLSTEDLRGGTCTVTNYGSLGGRYATPMIRPPECAIVGFGAIRERPIAIGGAVVARPTLPISVAVDHRLIDGDLMTAFQEHIIGSLLDPVALLAR